MAVARRTGKRQIKGAKIRELKELILSRFPDARFEIAPAPDTRRTTAVWTYTAGDDVLLRELVQDFEFFTMAEHDIHIITLHQPIEAWEE